MQANRRERRGLEHGRPAFAGRVTGERCGGSIGKPLGELGRKRDPGLGWLRRELEGSDDPTDSDCCVDVIEPQAELLVLLGRECLLQLGGELTSCLVAGHHWIVGRSDHAPQVAQVEIVDVGLRRGCTIEPLGDAQLGQQLLGHRQHARCRDLLLAGGLQLGVLLVHSLAYRRDATLQGALGHGALGLWQVGEHRGPVGPAGLQPLRLRALRQLGRGSEVGAAATLGTGTASVGPIAIACRAVATRTIVARPVATRAITSGTVATWAVGTIAALAPVA